MAIYCPKCLKDGRQTTLLGGAHLKRGGTCEQTCPVCKNRIWIDVDIDGIIKTDVIKSRKAESPKST